MSRGNSWNIPELGRDVVTECSSTEPLRSACETHKHQFLQLVWNFKKLDYISLLKEVILIYAKNTPKDPSLRNTALNTECKHRGYLKKPKEKSGTSMIRCWASLVAHLLKNLPAVQETWVWSLSWEDLLEKEMATHSSILAWRIPWTEESGRLQSMELEESDTT